MRVIGDIPYLTEAVTTAIRGKGIEPFRTLPAMPAPTVMCSSHAKKMNAIAGTSENRESSEDESDDGDQAEIRVRSRYGSCWTFNRGKLVLFVYGWTRGVPDPIKEAIREPWTIEYLAGSLPVCKVRATLRDGNKLSIWRDWMKPLGYQDPTHTVDVQVSVLEDADWKGKMIFKIPRDEQARKLHDVIENVRTVVDRFTRPDPQEHERNRNKTENNRKSRRECPACAADSIGLCSIHERDIFEIRDEEHQNYLVAVTAEAAKGGIPDNFDDQECEKEEMIVKEAMPSQPSEATAEATSGDKPTPEKKEMRL